MDRSHLQKKIIINKKGKKQTVWIKNPSFKDELNKQIDLREKEKNKSKQKINDPKKKDVAKKYADNTKKIEGRSLKEISDKYNAIDLDERWTKFRDAEDSDYLILYHATSLGNAESIFDKGFDIDTESNWKDGVSGYAYLGERRNLGTYEGPHKNSVLIAVKVKKSDIEADKGSDWKGYAKQYKDEIKRNGFNRDNPSALATFASIGQVRAANKKVIPIGIYNKKTQTIIEKSLKNKLNKAETDFKLQDKIDFQGLKISIENKKGSYRKGVDKDGHVWKTFMNFAYGRIPRTRGVDDDMVDVYIGPDKNASHAYVVSQHNPVSGKYDEDKVMLGFKDSSAAEIAYLRQYDRPGFFGGMTPMPMEEFKEKVFKTANIKNKEKRMLKIVKAIMKAVVGKSNKNINKKLYSFFQENKNPSDKKFHEFAEKNNVDPHVLEEKVYGLLSDLINGGLSEGKEFDYNKDEMKMGMGIEMEHTNNPIIAHKIALDHLKENPKYYTALSKIEGTLNKSEISQLEKRNLLLKEAKETGTFLNNDMFKAKDIAKLHKKVIINKKGQKQTVYVKGAESLIDRLFSFFGVKDKKQLDKRRETVFETNDLNKKYGITRELFDHHFNEYFNNKQKWDMFFSKKNQNIKGVIKKKEGKMLSVKIKKDAKWNTQVMKFLHEMFKNGLKEEIKTEEPVQVQVEDQKVESKKYQLENGSKVLIDGVDGEIIFGHYSEIYKEMSYDITDKNGKTHYGMRKNAKFPDGFIVLPQVDDKEISKNIQKADESNRAKIENEIFGDGENIEEGVSSDTTLKIGDKVWVNKYTAYEEIQGGYWGEIGGEEGELGYKIITGSGFSHHPKEHLLTESKRFLEEKKIAKQKEEQLKKLESGELGFVTKKTDRIFKDFKTGKEVKITATDYTDIRTDQIKILKESDVVEKEKPPYIPEMDEKSFRGYKGRKQMFDFVSLGDNKYLVATKKYESRGAWGQGDMNERQIKDNEYIIVNLDHLVAINSYYKNKMKAEYRKIHEKNEASREERYKDRYKPKRFSAPRAKRDVIFGSTRSLIQDALGIERLMAHKVYLDAVDKINLKVNDMQIQREFDENTYTKGEETSYGNVNIDNSLLKDYGVNIKNQNGSDMTPGIRDYLKSNLDDIYKTFGNKSEMAEKYNLKLSYAGEKRMHARKAIGIFFPHFKAIGVTDSGGKATGFTLAHEWAHFMDNYSGEKKGRHFSSDDYSSNAFDIADDFRKNLRKKSKSAYVNRTCECFARAFEQYHALKTVSTEEWEGARGAGNMYVPVNYFKENIMPKIDRWLSDNKDILKAQIPLDIHGKKGFYNPNEKIIKMALNKAGNLIKGRVAQVGETRTQGGVLKRKVAPGKWEPVKGAKTSPKKPEGTTTGKKPDEKKVQFPEKITENGKERDPEKFEQGGKSYREVEPGIFEEVPAEKSGKKSGEKTGEISDSARTGIKNAIKNMISALTETLSGRGGAEGATEVVRAGGQDVENVGVAVKNKKKVKDSLKGK